jgi:heme/copper-type cytochrome/quinol oxidase subunit 3
LSTSARLQQRTSSSWAKIFLFWMMVVLCVGLFFIPAFVIRPFSYQSPKALMMAMEIRHYAPPWTIVLLVASFLLSVTMWRKARRGKKALLVLGLVLASFATVMSRLDYFEWMFHPLPSPGFESAESTKLDPKQMVIGVKVGSDTRAYPIRAMAYHHVVNDVVSGVPIVVTY